MWSKQADLTSGGAPKPTIEQCRCCVEECCVERCASRSACPSGGAPAELPAKTVPILSQAYPGSAPGPPPPKPVGEKKKKRK